MKNKKVELRSLPSGWEEISIDQFRQIEKIRGTFLSKTTYLTHCFLILEGIKPLRYAQRWRSFGGKIPLVKRFISMTGRRLIRVEEDYLRIGEPFYVWEQCYRFRGFWNALFGRRFWIPDEDLLFFVRKLDFLTDKNTFRILKNPVPEKRIRFSRYRSYRTCLSDMSWEAYNLCNMFMEQYVSTRHSVYLDNFLSVLYRMDNPKLAHRVFSYHEIHMILLFWQSVQEYFMKSFPHLFKKNNANKKIRDYMKNEANITVFLCRQSYSTPASVRGMRAYDALQYLEINSIEYEEKERMIQRAKRRG